MGIFEIPTGPPITKRGGTYLVSKSKHSKSTLAPYGSITYDRKRGDIVMLQRALMSDLDKGVLLDGKTLLPHGV